MEVGLSGAARDDVATDGLGRTNEVAIFRAHL
jgi:hypothetical protein